MICHGFCSKPLSLHDFSSYSLLSRLHDPILEETHGAQNLFKEPKEGNLEGFKTQDESSSKGSKGLPRGFFKDSKGPHDQLMSLLSSFTVLQQKLRCSKAKHMQNGNSRNINSEIFFSFYVLRLSIFYGETWWISNIFQGLMMSAVCIVVSVWEKIISYNHAVL